MPASRSFAALAAMLLLGTGATHAQLGAKSPSIDKRLKKALDKAGLKYDIDDDGDAQLVYSLDDGRTQAVFIRSSTESVGSLEIREVFSFAYRAPEPLPTTAAIEALKDNAERAIGNWELVENKDIQALVFNVELDADAVPEALKTVLSVVATIADEREKALLGTDEL